MSLLDRARDWAVPSRLTEVAGRLLPWLVLLNVAGALIVGWSWSVVALASTVQGFPEPWPYWGGGATLVAARLLMSVVQQGPDEAYGHRVFRFLAAPLRLAALVALFVWVSFGLIVSVWCLAYQVSDVMWIGPVMVFMWLACRGAANL